MFEIGVPLYAQVGGIFIQHSRNQLIMRMDWRQNASGWLVHHFDD
jgi:hypothetical protein